MLSHAPESADSYQVPTNEVSVKIALRGGEPEEMSVFLHSHAASHPGRERPSDLLLNDDVFLPSRGGDGRMQLIHKSSIAWMTVAHELEMSGRGHPEHQVSTERCEPIDVTLDDGRVFVGEVGIMLPDASSRLQDFLNSAQRFFEVRSDEGVHFVNRDRIVMVKVTE
jgi:hypothetical protein